MRHHLGIAGLICFLLLFSSLGSSDEAKKRDTALEYLVPSGLATRYQETMSRTISDSQLEKLGIDLNAKGGAQALDILSRTLSSNAGYVRSSHHAVFVKRLNEVFPQTLRSQGIDERLLPEGGEETVVETAGKGSPQVDFNRVAQVLSFLHSRDLQKKEPTKTSAYMYLNYVGKTSSDYQKQAETKTGVFEKVQMKAAPEERFFLELGLAKREIQLDNPFIEKDFDPALGVASQIFYTGYPPNKNPQLAINAVKNFFKAAETKKKNGGKDESVLNTDSIKLSRKAMLGALSGLGVGRKVKEILLQNPDLGDRLFSGLIEESKKYVLAAKKERGLKEHEALPDFVFEGLSKELATHYKRIFDILELNTESQKILAIKDKDKHVIGGPKVVKALGYFEQGGEVVPWYIDTAFRYANILRNYNSSLKVSDVAADFKDYVEQVSDEKDGVPLSSLKTKIKNDGEIFLDFLMRKGVVSDAGGGRLNKAVDNHI